MAHLKKYIDRERESKTRKKTFLNSFFYFEHFIAFSYVGKSEQQHWWVCVCLKIERRRKKDMGEPVCVCEREW